MGFFLLFGFSPGFFFERLHCLAASQRHLVAADGMTGPVNRSFVQKEILLLNSCCFSIDILYSCFVFKFVCFSILDRLYDIFNHIFLFFSSFFKKSWVIIQAC